MSTKLNSLNKLNATKVTARLSSYSRARAMLPLAIEMVDSMKKVAKTDQELTVEERNLLSVAYKNLIGARRASWRIITNIESKEESKSEQTRMAMIKKYRSQVCRYVPVASLDVFRLGRKGTPRHLPRHSRLARQEPSTQCRRRRKQSLLSENEGRLPSIQSRVRHSR